MVGGIREDCFEDPSFRLINFVFNIHADILRDDKKLNFTVSLATKGTIFLIKELCQSHCKLTQMWQKSGTIVLRK